VEAIADQPLLIPKHLIELGLIELNNDEVRATDSGRPLLNQLIEAVMY